MEGSLRRGAAGPPNASPAGKLISRIGIDNAPKGLMALLRGEFRQAAGNSRDALIKEASMGFLTV